MNITNTVDDLFEGGFESPWYFRYAMAAAILWGAWFLNVETNIAPDWAWLPSLMLVGYAAVLARELSWFLLCIVGLIAVWKIAVALPTGLAIVIGACIVASGCKGRGAQ